MQNLQLSLKTKWFEMTKSGVKTEDYREITPYWAKRLFFVKDQNLKSHYETVIKQGLFNDKSFKFLFDKGIVLLKNFECNIMTLGCPKKGDVERILKLQHKGIEIRTGNPDWGAEEGKIYFVILHAPTE